MTEVKISKVESPALVEAQAKYERYVDLAQIASLGALAQAQGQQVLLESHTDYPPLGLTIRTQTR